MTGSLRPPFIKVRMVGNGTWSEKTAKILKEKMGALVVRDSIPVNGCVRDSHILIVDGIADPSFNFLKNLREKWSERDLPVIVVDDNDNDEVAAMRAGANAFIDRSIHSDTTLLEKLVYGLACEG